MKTADSLCVRMEWACPTATGKSGYARARHMQALAQESVTSKMRPPRLDGGRRATLALNSQGREADCRRGIPGCGRHKRERYANHPSQLDVRQDRLARDRLVKVKTDSQGDVHYEAWSQPHGDLTVLTKMSGATYQRLTDAVKPTKPIA